MTPLCFLDMDGVLADFVGGICEAHHRASPYTQENYGQFDMEPLWGIDPGEFWKGTQHDGFWFGLCKTPEADAIVDLVCGQFGADNVAVLTAPSQDYRCIPEKQKWMAAYYPQLRNNMLFGSAKRFLAGSNRVLLDDRDKNIDNFQQAGGIGITVPRLWNCEWPNANKTVEVLRFGLKVFWQEVDGTTTTV